MASAICSFSRRLSYSKLIARRLLEPRLALQILKRWRSELRASFRRAVAVALSFGRPWCGCWVVDGGLRLVVFVWW
ncbi:MAG: hypothetical protein HCTETUND1_126 [Candidatus Hodgkinia cicadicola]|nr:MAG: hypothetical protein HCTETUND1_126 [Candidatus Hodgkinia cicadicola]